MAMPVFPGTEDPSIEHLFTIKENGFAESRLTMFSHVGTHMDSPGHMLEGGQTLDQYDVERFVGKAIVLDVSRQATKSESYSIRLENLMEHEPLIRQVDFVILHTGWSHKWGSDEYYKGFPALSIEAAEWLATLPLKGIGVDAISIDLMDTITFPVHKILMKKEMLIIENLTNIEPLIGAIVMLSALPLKYENADGAPVRAVAMLYQPFGSVQLTVILTNTILIEI
jgi:kynurenine formamidase